MSLLDADTLLAGLTEPQRAAVLHVDGPLLVLAGPGSGKTTVVTRRIAHLVSCGIPPWQILALTFTNKAAESMRERVARLLPEEFTGRRFGAPSAARGLTVSTFHALGARLLRRYADAAGISPRFTIYDGADQRDAIKQALREAQLSEDNFTPSSVASKISGAKNRLMDPSGFAAEARDFFERGIGRAYAAYQKILRRNDALDFDDLLLLTARLLREDGGVANEVRERSQYLLIDEYQDTNHAQFTISSALAGSHRNVCVVGDPDQSIYAWRGADIRNILEFEAHYPDAVVVPLGRNFRSTGHIVEAADRLIRHNRRRKERTLSSELGPGEKPQVLLCRDEHDEASAIVRAFRRLHEERGDEGEPVPWREMAVLYRMNALSRVVEDAFRSAQIPYVVARGTAFFERKEVKDALSYLRLVANPADEVALRRVINEPPRGIGRTTQERLEAFASQAGVRPGEALGRASEIATLPARAATAVTKFAKLLEGWRSEALLSGMEVAHESPSPASLREAGSHPSPASLREGCSHPSPASLREASSPRPAGSGEAGPLARLVERVLRESGLERLYRLSGSEEDLDRLENLEELINAAAGFEGTVAGERAGGTGVPGDPEAQTVTADPSPAREAVTVLDLLVAWLESVALVSDADAIDPASGAVTLMTLHAAKGLEFDSVAMIALEHGLLPHARSMNDDDGLEEERRLCFVGMTRAKRHLLMSRALVRTHRGMREATIPSPFLDELPPESVVRPERASEELDPFLRHDGGAGRSDGRRAFSDFPVGSVVRHPTFGIGVVESVSPRSAGSSARVRFGSVGTKTLILEYARLERMP